MAPSVAIIAPGSMGAAVGARLRANGVAVYTSLEGRGADSRERAASAGMRVVSDAQLLQTDLLLSIVPPGAALRLAERLVPGLRAAPHRPTFVDCNAVSPGTVERIERLVAAAGARFVDVGIIGGPPRPGYSGPNFYASGAHAADLATLAAYGLDVRVLKAPVGAASALKMAYAGITKGITAVGSVMLLAAARNGVAEALRAELSESQAALLDSFRRSVPASFPKAYRWVAEMQEIAKFAAADPAAAAIFGGASEHYSRITADLAGERRETSILDQFLADR